MNERRLTPADRLISGLDDALRVLAAKPSGTRRPSPASDIEEAELDEGERRHAAALMRVNHAGEVAAQGLYQGHAAVARNASIREQMTEAAEEELDHLAWCEDRIEELGSSKSVLGPLWYSGSFLIGAASGVLGDKWSLGFIEETERQVSDHLSNHLEQLPAKDERSRAIVAQMRDEEEAHGQHAGEAGAAPLPEGVRTIMTGVANIMKFLAYRV